MPKRISNGKGWLTLLFATTLLPQRLFTILDSAADCQDAAAFAGKNASNWVVVARRRGDLGALVDASNWGTPGRTLSAPTLDRRFFEHPPRLKLELSEE